MQKTKDQINYFFVDESGDTTFYNKTGDYIVGQEGCSKILMLGFIKTKSPELIRKTLSDLRTELVNNDALKHIPSIKKTAVSFHAKNDCPEVRKAVFTILPHLNFTSQIVVARKTKRVINMFNNKPNDLYDYLISNLFRNVLHKSTVNKVYFAVRGNSKRQEPMCNAIKKALELFEKKWDTKITTSQLVFPQSPSGEACLQVTDYINWSLFRAYTTGETEYFQIVKDKIRLIVDLYDYKEKWGNFYSKNNPFEINKISPL